MIRTRTFQPAVSIATAVAVVAATGCSRPYYHRYAPTPSDRAIAERIGVEANPAAWGKKMKVHVVPERSTNAPAGLELFVTDIDAAMFAARSRDLLRGKATISRMAREVSATAQIMTAAAAATLGAVSGGATKAVAILAGTSAIIPELQQVFTAKERAEAYNQGASLVADAEARFLTATSGKLDMSRLSPQGAHLIEETVAALRLVETAIISQIPDINEVQRAKGIRLQNLAVSHESITVYPAAAFDVGTTDGTVVTAAYTDDPAVATVRLSGSDGKSTTATVTAVGAGSTRLRLFAANNRSADVLVEYPLAEPTKTVPTVVPKGTKTKELVFPNATNGGIQVAVFPADALTIDESSDLAAGKLVLVAGQKTYKSVQLVVTTPHHARRVYQLAVE